MWGLVNAKQRNRARLPYLRRKELGKNKCRILGRHRKLLYRITWTLLRIQLEFRDGDVLYYWKRFLGIFGTHLRTSPFVRAWISFSQEFTIWCGSWCAGDAPPSKRKVHFLLLLTRLMPLTNSSLAFGPTFQLSTSSPCCLPVRLHWISPSHYRSYGVL